MCTGWAVPPKVMQRQRAENQLYVYAYVYMYMDYGCSTYMRACIRNVQTMHMVDRVLVTLAAAVTTKHWENVAVISSYNSLLYLMRTGSQRYG